jgi:hypothetical protein
MAHMTVAASENLVRRSMSLLTQNFSFEKQDQQDHGAFTVGYHIKCHLEGGTIDLRADNTVEIKELDLKWDKLEVRLGLDIPEVCVGGGCLGPFCLPRYCIFSGDPDVSIAPDFAALVAQEVSVIGGVIPRYFDVDNPPALNALCQFVRNQLVSSGKLEPFDHDEWQLFLDPETIDIDLFDFPDIVGDLIENALSDLVTALIPGGVVRDLVLAVIGGVTDIIRAVLDIGDDIDEWLSDLFNVSFGLGDFILTAIADFLGHCIPIYRMDDPFEIMPATPEGLIAVTAPIRNVVARVDATELVVQADIGA